MSLDISPALRSAMLATPAIADALEQWKSAPAIFTRRPIPADAPHRIALINPETAISDGDGLISERPIVMRDIAIYGRKAEAGSPLDDTRTIEAVGYAIRSLFHRQRFSFSPSGFSVIDVVARGPFPAPTDDDQTVGRIVSLTVRLRRE